MGGDNAAASETEKAAQPAGVGGRHRAAGENKWLNQFDILRLHVAPVHAAEPKP